MKNPCCRQLDDQPSGGETRVERVGRNCLCPCNSGKKYKHCCLERDVAEERRQRLSKVLRGLFDSSGKLAQFEKYAAKVFSVPKLLSDFTDSRVDPDIPTFDVVNSLFHAALLLSPVLVSDGVNFTINCGMDFSRFCFRFPFPCDC